MARAWSVPGRLRMTPEFVAIDATKYQRHFTRRRQHLRTCFGHSSQLVRWQVPQRLGTATPLPASFN
tara:strand:+ start:11168 stop:11368 length:201 start_codon:yes stop_codon:yes gene_type:complete